MKSILLKLASHLCPQKGKQLAISFIINFLLLFSFSLSSYFRPYYEHKNKNMNPYCVTFIKGYYKGEENTKEYFEKNAVSLFKNVRKTYYSTCKEVPDSNISVLFVKDDFPLKELGSFPSIFHADENSALMIREPNISVNAVMEYLPFLNDMDVQEKGSGAFLDKDMPFRPFISKQCLVIVNEKYINQVTAENFTIYCTVESQNHISDALLSKIAKISMNTGFIQPLFDSFIHPASDYMRYYGLISPITNTLLYLDILLSVTIFVSFAFSKYLWLIRNREELEFYLLFGMKENTLKGMLTITGGIPYLLSNLITYLAYLIFMWIFSSLNGFTFFFQPYFYVAYFGLVFLDFLIQYIFSLIAMRKISQEKAIIKE